MGWYVKKNPILALSAVLVAATLAPGPHAGAATPWQLAATAGPPGRLGAAMAYDPLAQRVVLVGGCRAYTTTTATVTTKDDEDTPVFDERVAVTLDPFAWCAPGDELADVWTWDGTSWTAVTTSGPAPYARYGAALTYDYTARRLTLFGGLYQTDIGTGPDAADADECIETEEHYGVQGTESVHDDVTGRNHTYYCFHDTWQLAHSGSTWSWVKLAPATTPPSRFQAGMAYDASGRPVLAGGCHSLGMMGTHVQPKIPTTFGCAEYAAVESPMAAQCPLFGLMTVYSPICGETEAYAIDSWRLDWSGDTPDWTQVGCLTPCAGPTPAYGMDLAFDPASRTLHYWGGYYYEPVNAYNGYEGAVYSFDGDWHQVLRAGKQDQWCNSLSAFTAFGGSAPAWLDGRWQVLRTGGHGMYMSARQQSCAAETSDRWYDPAVDPATDCQDNPGCPHITRPTAPRDWDDTWSWDSGRTCPTSDGDRNCWVFRGTGTPNARVGAAMAYDVAAHQVVVFGGAPGLGDTWVYPTAVPPGDPCGTPCGM